jgi:hypothetical protein
VLTKHRRVVAIRTALSAITTLVGTSVASGFIHRFIDAATLPGAPRISVWQNTRAPQERDFDSHVYFELQRFRRGLIPTLVQIIAAAFLLMAGLTLPQAKAAVFTQQGPELVGTGAVGNAYQGNSVSLSADGNTAIMGGPSDNGSVGAAWVFTRSGSGWIQQAKLVGTDNTGPHSAQGQSVALSADGNTAIVGGDLDNSGSGAAWVFTRSGGVWNQQGAKLVGTGAVGNAYQGSSLALSADGNTAIVGGKSDNGSTGAAWVFTRSGGVWTQQGAKLVGSGAVGTTSIQGSVALSADGNTAIMGGWGDNGNVGAAWVFTRSGGVWTQQGTKLVGSGAVGDAAQAEFVALSADGNTAILGGPVDNFYIGAAWIFTRSGGVWTQQGAKLVGTGAVGTSYQGFPVALFADGNTAIMGGWGDNGQIGAAWVFIRSGGVWTQQGAKLVGTGAVGSSTQGSSVTISADGNTAILGEPRDGNGAGAAWVFVGPPTVNFTTTAIGTSLNPSTFGQSVTFTATVMSSGGTPTGIVTFYDGATVLGNGLLSGGTASFGWPLLSAGDHTITAKYNGDGYFTPSTSAPLTQTVNALPSNTLVMVPATGISSSGNQGGPFSPGIFSYQLSASSGTIDYTITSVPAWLIPSATSGTVDTSGTIVTFIVAANSLTPATYNSGPIVITNVTNGQGNTTRAATLTVNPATTTTGLYASANPSGFGKMATFAAAVKSTGGTPTGTVKFYDGAAVLGSGTLSNGAANISNATLGIGPHTITAVYGGDGIFTGSTSPPLTQLVTGVANTFVSARNGTDAGVCPVIAPCATLNYALSVTDTGGQVTIVDGGVFGPIVITQPVSIIGSKTDPVEIGADLSAQVGCIGALPASCGLNNNGYAVEIATGPTDIVKISDVFLGAGLSGGVGALKFSSGGQIQLSRNVYRGNDTQTGPIIALYPNNPGTTQAQVYFSNSDIGFNSNNANAGAIEVKPSGNTSLMLHFNHVEVHNASYGIRTDSSLLTDPLVNVTTAISESEFFSFANAAVNTFSTAGTGLTNAVFDAVRILNANIAIKANGPQSTVMLTNSTVSGNGIGVQVQNGAHVYTPQSNTISGNGTDLSGSLSSAPPK